MMPFGLRDSDRRLFVSLIGALVVFVITASYLVIHTLQVPVLSDPTTVTVTMTRTGGLYAGSAVTYRGKQVGKVLSVELSTTGSVAATVRLDPGTEIPAAARVRVRSLSPVGEQYLDFQPRSDQAPYLADGSSIHASAEDLPTTLATTVINLGKLVDQVDPKLLRSVVSSMGTALGGTGGDIADILDGTAELVGTIDQEWPRISRVLLNTETLLRMGSRNATAIRSFSRDARLIAGELKNFDPELRDVFDRTPQQFVEMVRLIGVLDRALPPVLSRTIKLTDILVFRDPHLRELLQRYPVAIRALGDAMYDGAMRGQLMLQQDFQCVYDGPKRAPTELKAYPMYTEGQCESPSNRVVRGAKQAPGPTSR